jgi:hypothetical protein
MINKDIINSKEFKELLTSAIKTGIGEEWSYDGENEYPVDTFDPDHAVTNTLELLNSKLT